MRVLIIDPVSYMQEGRSTGHYLAVAQNLLKVFSGKHETLVMGGNVYIEKFANCLLPLKRNTCDTFNKVHNKWNTLLNVRQVYHETTSDDVLIWQSCSVATVLMGILLFGRNDRRSFLIQYNARMVSTKWFRLLFSLVKKKLTGIVCTLDEVGKQFKMPYCVIPDYIYCGYHQVDYLPYNKRKYDFCMVGMIREDKGILEVANRIVGTSYKVLIAGRPDNEKIRQDLLNITSQASNVTLKLEYVSEEEYDAYIRNSKYCILNYQGDYAQRTSGVVYDVLFKGTPVIGNNCKGLYFIKENHIGYLFDDLERWDPSKILSADVHRHLVSSIQRYFLTHVTFQQKINDFIETT